MAVVACYFMFHEGRYSIMNCSVKYNNARFMIDFVTGFKDSFVMQFLDKLQFELLISLKVGYIDDFLVSFRVVFKVTS